MVIKNRGYEQPSMSCMICSTTNLDTTTRLVIFTSLIAWFQKVTNKEFLIKRGGEGNLGTYDQALEREIIFIFYLFR